MESVSYSYGKNARRGGMDLTISLTPDDVAALGIDGAGELTRWFDTALRALAMFRGDDSHRATSRRMADVVRDLDQGLLPRLQAVRDTAVHRHGQLGGSINDLAAAMNVAKSTAQSRRNALTKGAPHPWKQWVIHGRAPGQSQENAPGERVEALEKEA
ncbi:hypothetical protein [Streptomyces sp. NPDC005732]|uniref:hypothetical protein n=1 Tax=Streptomyces sp. NPDC005732 TaxID=3157057 RepID=UPI0034015B06